VRRSDLPGGTVTFLFTDVEGSTRLLHELGAKRYAQALAEHRRVIREACGAHRGVEVDTQGDAFFFAFPTAPGALAAASALTEALDSGPIQVRVGLHTGTPLVTDEGYVGDDVHRAARIGASGHGGQVLVSAATAQLVERDGLRDLGEHRFKDLAASERVYQLGDRDFPAPKSLYRTNLPVPATRFLGRERELREVADLLSPEGARLLTLTGPGGTGKTRLALQAAAEVAERFPDGLWWVPLAPVRDPALVLSVVAQTLEVQEEPGSRFADSIAAALAGKRALVLLDNVEHLLPHAADEITALGPPHGCVALVTSRERLQVQGEQVYPVPTLEESDGIELFFARARALDPTFAANGAVAQLCARLDNLPLALELAAARTVVFSPGELLERLTHRLDLLKAGRHADPRQQTLRATIEWSYDLLDEEEKRLFKSVSVFVGGWTYEAAEEICDADPDTLQSLLDKSLIRRRDTDLGSRYWMLETIREYAGERLDESGEADDLRHAHAAHFSRRAVELYPSLREYTGNAAAIIREELGNMRAALDFALGGDHPAIAGDLIHCLWFYWLTRGSGREAAGWARRYLESARERLSPVERLPGDFGVAEILRFTGDPDTAATLKRELVDIGRAHPDVAIHGRPIAGGIAATLSDLVYMELDAGRVEEARAYAEEALALRRELGKPQGVAHALMAIAAIAYHERDFVRYREILSEGIVNFEAAEMRGDVLITRIAMAECELLMGRPTETEALLREAIPQLHAIGDRMADVGALRVAAMLAQARGDCERCAALFGAADRMQDESGVTYFGKAEDEIHRAYLDRARDELDEEAFARAYERGASLPDEDAFALALSA
jgi:predicted ATPase/class 3 adenylate cyclase